MKVRIAHSTSSPFPQFVVEAETNEEKLLLGLFVDASGTSKDELKFHLHGHSRASDGVSSFNFGWIKKPDTELKPVRIKDSDNRYINNATVATTNLFMTHERGEAMVFDNYDQAKAFLRKCGHEVGNWIIEPVNESK